MSYRVAVPNLRQKLFEMTANNGEESNLASACLTALDELRDQYGYIDSEPRNPGIGDSIDGATGRLNRGSGTKVT